MTQSWTRLTFVHWQYDAGVLAPLLPPGVRPDVLEGSAWVGLVPFAMRRVRLFGAPPLPHVSAFLETNVRTYTVGPDGTRGIFFLTLEADRLLPVLAARASYRLPYAWARMSLQQTSDVLTYESTRRWPARVGATSRVRVRVGGPVQASPLDHALTARWDLHSSWWLGRTLVTPARHDRWPRSCSTSMPRCSGRSGCPSPPVSRRCCTRLALTRASVSRTGRATPHKRLTPPEWPTDAVQVEMPWG